MSEYIKSVIKANVDQYVMIQPRPGVAFNLATAATGDGVSFDGDHPFPVIRRAGSNEQMIQLPLMMGKLVERNGVVYLKMLDDAGNSGKYLLVAVDPDIIMCVTVLADESVDPPKRVNIMESSRIIVPSA